jgi:flagellar biosynthesis protein FlhF
MHIKRFLAPDMRSAMRDIRAELGADAVILSNQALETGIEVIAAMDYDDALMSGSEDLASLDVPAEPVARTTGANAYGRVAGGVHEVPAASPVGGANVAVLENELKDMRQLLETQLASLAWNDLGHSRPLKMRVLRQLSRIGIDAELCGQIADAVPPMTKPADAWRVAISLLANKIAITSSEAIESAGVLAIVGPTGVGKTTTIAKIAARFALQHGAKSLALISTDTFRIGAREQLLTFARILGVPMHVAESARDLRALLDQLKRCKLVLIDTAGMSQRDLGLAQQFATLRPEGHDVTTLLALSAATERSAMGQIIDSFRPASPRALILTKLDEAVSLGPALSAVVHSELPIAYLADGQRVPEDLQAARGQRPWLLRRAVELAREYAPPQREDDLALTFGELELVANG